MRFFPLVGLGIAMGLILGSPTKSLADGHLNLDSTGLALQGFDPVSYFQIGGPNLGDSGIRVKHEGATYYFVSNENKAAFKANPDRYLPQYGGWCAYGFGMKPGTDGYRPGKFPVDPGTFKIFQGKLYLFYQDGEYNALQHWNQQELLMREKADARWSQLLAGGDGASGM